VSNVILKELDVTNFRSIRGHVHAPLDAKVVLIHGDNGAGKTSLLSAIEYGLTGNVLALHRADPDYAKHLLHRSASEGKIVIKTDSDGIEERFDAVLDAKGAHSQSRLDPKQASFFSERAYLPQSLLSQLLQIYQESRSDADSPLAKFVGDLLGLDRLDALEAGLKPLGDVRNLRKIVELWSDVESEKDRRDQFVSDRTKVLASIEQSMDSSLLELKRICEGIELKDQVTPATLDAIISELRKEADEKEYDNVLDHQRTLGSIRRQIASAEAQSAQPISRAEADAAAARTAFGEWESVNGGQMDKLRSNVNELLPSLKLSSDLFGIETEAMELLRREHQQLNGQAEQGRRDLRRTVEVQRELEAARQQMTIIETEISRISADASVLASALGELSSYIKSDVCPVCDRDFGELQSGPLNEHVQKKIIHLSASATRLLALGKSRGESQQTVSRLEIELETLFGRKITSETLVAFDRRSASMASTIAELQRMGPVIAEGASLRANDVAYRRAAIDLQASSSVLMDARVTVSDFAVSVGAEGIGPEEGFEAVVARLELMLKQRVDRLSNRLTLRRKGLELVDTIHSDIKRKTDVERMLETDTKKLKRVSKAMQNAQALRSEGQTVRDTVDGVRSAIIRRIFNDQLNRIWRDLFVRLAPSEPFVPAFRIPEAETRRLQPKLITVHRDTDEQGGTPGAMLSAGNLNTAALTLFIALHLSVSKVLPWLILDDPVQSMDDVHIAHFAALLRTLSKEHGRQVVIAVHDRQLFEYLRLELSPAFPDDSLVTLELIRGPRSDTHCVPDRLEFREETALFATA
jgi:DNA repair protein SbcC/Rad50